MLEGSLKTEVDTKYFGTRVNIDKVIFKGERYIYRIRKDKIYYTLKGYQIPLENLNPRSEESRRRLMEVTRSIGEAYQEFYLGRMASLFNQHFAKALEIDQQVDFPSNAPPQLYIEILLEYNGEPLSALGTLTFDLAYNLMRQSTSALALLQAAGLTQLDVSPTNLVYNKTNDLLTIMNNDIEPGYGAFNMVRVVEEEPREIQEFLIPGVMKEKRIINVPAVRLPMGNIDVYCWAMCFYAMLLGKNVGDLVEETNVRKLTSEAAYNKFMSFTRLALENIPIRELKEKKKKEFVIRTIYDSLNLNPRERPSLNELQKQMKEFEKTESINLPYQKTEQQQNQKLLKIFNNELTPKNQANLDNETFNELSSRGKDEYLYEMGGTNEPYEMPEYGIEPKQPKEEYSIPEFTKAPSGRAKYEIEEYKPDEGVGEFVKEDYYEKEVPVELDKFKLPEYNKEDYEYLLQDFNKGFENKDQEINYNKEDIQKERHNREKYEEIYEYTNDLGYNKEKNKFEIPEFIKEEDKYLIKQELNIPQVKDNPEYNIEDVPKVIESGKKFSDIMKTPEKYEIPDFIKEIGGIDITDIGQVNVEPKEPSPQKVLYNANKEEEGYLEPWNTKEKALYITPGKEKAQNVKPKISKENEYHEIVSKPKDIQETKRPQISSSTNRPQAKSPFIKDQEHPITSSTNKEKPKQEELMKLPLHKIEEKLPIDNIEDLLKDHSLGIDSKKEPVIPADITPRDDGSEYIPKMPMDISPQNTPSDNIIGYNRPIEHSQFAKNVELAQSTYVSDNPLTNKETIPEPIKKENVEMPKVEPLVKKPEPRLPEPPPARPLQTPTVPAISSKAIGGQVQPPVIPSSKNKEVIIETQSASTLTKNPAGKEEKREVIRPKICKDCIKGDKAKGVLNCGHSVCSDCLTQFAANYFANNKPFRHCAFCSTCKRIDRLSTYFSIDTLESITLECGCKWTEFGTKINNIIHFNGLTSS